jgi:two-component system sensor histidine kinase RegB
MSEVAATPHAINFAWLIRLRWGSIAGQLCTVLAAERLMGLSLPVAALLTVIGVEAASNLACALAARSGRPAREGWLVAVMGFDTLVLTALLYLTGGPFNPFSFLYLVQIALAAVVLREPWTWLLVLLSMACSAVLFARHLPLDAGDLDHMTFHLRGMWVEFVVAAAFHVYFLMRVTRALAARERDLAAAHRTAAQQEKLASLATLAAGAAHELSTPLSTIALVAKELERHLAAEASASASSVEDARLIRAQVDRCRQILERMAADAGQSAGEGMADVPLGELVARSLSGVGEQPPVRVELDEALRSVRVRLPPRAVAEAMRGLIRNAQQATATGGEVQVRARLSDGRRLEIVVRDEGAGMAPDVLARAGEPFFTTKAPGQGMGLGLFLSRALMQRLGGELRLDSRPGAGTSAMLLLPLATDGSAVT